MIPSRDELLLVRDVVEWSCLRAHLARGGLILIDISLDLIDAAINITRDDTALIEEWIIAGKIGKPSESQIQSWDEDKAKLFSMLIVSPYVLIQEHQPMPHL